MFVADALRMIVGRPDPSGPEAGALMKRLAASLVLGASILAAPVLAADGSTYSGPPVDGSDLVLVLGAGALVQPSWEGSDEIVFSPWPIVSLEYLSLGRFTLGGGPARAFSLRPSFGFRGERDDTEDARLNGIGDVDPAFELGAAASVRYGYFLANLAVRRGFGGHDGFVGEASAEIVIEPTDRWSFAFGPEVTFADDEYMDTYFGVSAAQAAASGLTPFNAGAGFKSAGLIARSRYALTDAWTLHAKASWHHLLGDAADSPIIKAAGNENQFMAGVGLSYRFRFDLFN